MFRKLDDVESRFNELAVLLADPVLANNQKSFTAYMKEYASLQELVAAYQKYKKVRVERDSTKIMMESEKDSTLQEMAKSELPGLEAEVARLEAEMKILLLPKDPNDDKNIFLEVRMAAGGDEAALFVESLFTMYSRYAQKNGWQTEIMSMAPGNMGGFKEVIVGIRGQKVFSKLKYESGVHRVQRVPKTETQGRIHTSTVTVAVLPEVEEVDININATDLKIDVFRSGGPGGQSVNTTDSAVRITHVPTGVVVVCQDEKSQIKNKAKALKVLYARLYDAEKSKQETELSAQRRGQMGSGDRSERIRTYNFPQGRVTDHRIGLTLYQIDKVVGGELDEVIQPLIAHYQALSLKAQ